MVCEHQRLLSVQTLGGTARSQHCPLGCQDQFSVDVEDVEMNDNLLVKEDEKGKDISNYDEMMGHHSWPVSEIPP